jgi:hypothetical protein
MASGTIRTGQAAFGAAKREASFPVLVCVILAALPHDWRLGQNFMQVLPE